MEDQKPTNFKFEIDNFFDKEEIILSPKFLSGGCEWYVKAYPKGYNIEDHLSLYLCVANPESLRLGWKRRATFSFVLLSQSGEEIYKTKEYSNEFFCAQVQGWGNSRAVPLKNLQEKGVMETNKLIVKVQVHVLEVVDESEVTGNETLDFEGFHVPYSQVDSVSSLFSRHMGFAVNFKPKNQLVRTTYMNILLSLIETLDKPPHSLSEIELTKGSSDLIDLTEAGFKLDWLNKKLDEVSLKRKKTNEDCSRVRELEEQVKNLKAELKIEKKKSAACAAKTTYVDRIVSDIKKLFKKRKLSTQ